MSTSQHAAGGVSSPLSDATQRDLAHWSAHPPKEGSDTAVVVSVLCDAICRMNASMTDHMHAVNTRLDGLQSRLDQLAPSTTSATTTPAPAASSAHRYAPSPLEGATRTSVRNHADRSSGASRSTAETPAGGGAAAAATPEWSRYCTAPATAPPWSRYCNTPAASAKAAAASEPEDPSALQHTVASAIRASRANQERARS